MKQYYVTTPIYYINDKPHIGHIYTTMAADIMARFKRSQGHQVMFLTGTDENAVKIERTAHDKSMTTQAFVDNLAEEWEIYFKQFGLTFDDFIRTTQPRHIKTVQMVIQRLFNQGYIYKGTYEGLYCLPCETYINESDLRAGKCPDCGRVVEKISEENYFFKLSNFRDKLLDYFEKNPSFIQPKSRFNEVYSVLKEGLRDVSFTRTGVGWGIKVPFDEKHTVYVWADALINYITACGYGYDPEKFIKTWPADLHLMAKEIIRFHCIIWPAMLMALDIPLPKKIFAHGWLTCDGQKMSKSLGNFVRPHIEVENLVKTAGCTEALAKDALRYFLFRELPFGDDGDFSRANLEARYNADLANDLGNLLNRSQQMLTKNYDGIVPQGEFLHGIEGKFNTIFTIFIECMNKLKFNEALEALWSFINELNTSIEVNKPWELVKQGKQRELDNLHYTLIDGIRIISSLVAPLMPETANILAKAVGLQKPPDISGLMIGQMVHGYKINKTNVMFPRIKKEPVQQMTQVQKASQPSFSVQTVEEDLMTIEDFQKFKLRTAKVINVERVEGADKLLKLTVDIGNEFRTIVAGIAKYYSSEDLIGKTIVMIINLKPAKLKGIISQGMLLAATNKNSDNVYILTPQGIVEPGSVVK